MKVFLSSILLALVIACQPKERSVIHFSEFKHSISLTGSRYELRHPISGCLMYNSDSLLILSSIRGSDEQIQVYNLNNFEFLASNGILGRGPGEITSVSFTCYNDKVLYYQDIGKRKIMAFDIDSIISFPEYKCKKLVEMPNVLALLYFDIYTDNIFSFISPGENKSISFFNTKGEMIDSLRIVDKSYPYAIEEQTSETNLYMASFLFTVNRSLDRIAVAYTTSDVVNVLDLKGNTLKQLYGPGKLIQAPNYLNTKKILTTTLMKSDNDFIYCLYQNSAIFDKETGSIPVRTNKINVFSWEGAPVAQLSFNHPVQTFTIDRINGKIVTYAPDVDAFEVYDYPNILQTESDENIVIN